MTKKEQPAEARPDREQGEAERIKARLRDMLGVYRYRENLAEKLHRPDSGLKLRERHELAGEARTYGLCANEIEAVLRG